MIKLKNKEQIDGIRLSCQLLAQAIKMLEGEIRVGITTNELNSLAEKFIKRHGALPSFSKYGGFPTALCSSVNEVVIHGLPNDRSLQNGDLVGIDLGLELNGYFSDMAKSYAVGNISDKNRKLLEDTEKSLYLGINAIHVGGRINDIGKAISSYLKPLGYGVVYEFCGHGVGLEVHEEPQISHDYPSRGANPRIQAGMVLAIEPMVTMGKAEVVVNKNDGWSVCSFDKTMTAHFEHTVAVFDDHIEILTIEGGEIE